MLDLVLGAAGIILVILSCLRSSSDTKHWVLAVYMTLQLIQTRLDTDVTVTRHV